MYLSLRKLVLVWFLEILWLAASPSRGQILSVEYSNVAKGKKIVASTTCGEDSPYEDIYCGVEGVYTLNGTLVVQKQVIGFNLKVTYCVYTGGGRFLGRKHFT